MTRSHRAAALAALAVVVCAGSFAQTPQPSQGLTLTVDPYPLHGLPAIPPSLRVSVRNDSSRTVTLPRVALCIEGTDTAGKPFSTCDGSHFLDIDTLSHHFVQPMSPVTSIDIAANSTYVTFLAADDDVLFMEPVFGAAGRYDISFRLNTGNIVSNVTNYTIEPPQGENAAVWNAMSTRMGTVANPYFDAKLERVFAAHPNADYSKVWRHYQEDVIARGDMPSYVAHLQSRLAAGMPQSFVGLTSILLAGAYQQMAEERAERAGSVDSTATAWLEQGLAILRQSASSDDPYAVEAANWSLKTNPWTTHDLQSWVDARKPKKMLPIVPHADCVIRNPDGTYFAWFGYSSRNTGVYSIPIGANNTFSPEPAERGQPTTFLAGDHDRVYAVHMAPGEKLIWTVFGKPAVANATGDRSNCD